VVEQRLRSKIKVSKSQFGRSIMEAIYLLRHPKKRYRDNQNDLHMVFIDLDKAYDKVTREVLWRVLEKKRV